MQIIPDPIFAALMALPFAVTVFALWAILLEPMRAYLEGREQATVGARHEAHSLAHATEAKIVQIEERLGKAREASATRRAAVRQEALSAEQVAIEAARRQADGQVTAALASISQEAEAARGALQASARSLSTDIASQVLGRGVQA